MTAELRQKLINFSKKGGASFVDDIGIALADVDDGKAVVTLTPSEKVLNHWGRVHGGALFTLCDSACGMSAVSARQEQCVTVNCTVDFLAAGQGVLTATATVDRIGGKLCFCSVKVCDESGKAVANGHAIMCFSGKPLQL